MFYYHVWVRSERYQSAEPLTYSASESLSSGSVVLVPLRNQPVAGVVMEPTSKPRFATKPVITVYKLPALPPSTLKLMQWLVAYYPSALGVITQLFLPPTIRESAGQPDAV